MTQTVLILGASGRFGKNAATAFAEAGWQVRRFDRARDNLMQAAQGANVIVCAWNPPYTDWAAQVPALHRSVQEAALATGATVILPGNVYVFGAETPSPWSARSAHAARNPLGRIRIAMEDSYRKSGVRTIILRAGDFIDTSGSGNWFDKVLTARLDRGVFTYPGRPDIPHAWAFLPDLTRAAVALAERRNTLPVFADIPFPGYTLTGTEMAQTLGRVTGRDIRIKPMAWWPLTLLMPFWGMARHLREMRYLWDTPHALDGAAFASLLPGFAETPVVEALAQAVNATASPDRPIRGHDGLAGRVRQAKPAPN